MKITIRRPDDFHVHLRQGEMLRHVVHYTSDVFARALVMPNTQPAIVTGADAKRYRDDILTMTTDASPGFFPLMTVKLTRETTPAVVHGAREAGAVAIKFYPEGATTNAEGGFSNLLQVPRDVLGAIAAAGMVLSVHAEDPDAFCLDREEVCIPSLDAVLRQHRRLRMVVEHVTSAAMLEWIFGRAPEDRVGATITAHHLRTTLDDVVGGMLNPHAFCKPIPKTPRDRDALIEAATSGDPRIFFGSDSAPHVRRHKEGMGCAGAFTAPVALPLLTEIFEMVGKLDRLESFVSDLGAGFYGLPINEGTTTLETEGWRVPDDVDGIVPFLAGREMRWKATWTSRGDEEGG